MANEVQSKNISILISLWKLYYCEIAYGNILLVSSWTLIGVSGKGLKVYHKQEWKLTDHRCKIRSGRIKTFEIEWQFAVIFRLSWKLLLFIIIITPVPVHGCTRKCMFLRQITSTRPQPTASELKWNMDLHTHKQALTFSLLETDIAKHISTLEYIFLNNIFHKKKYWRRRASTPKATNYTVIANTK